MTHLDPGAPDDVVSSAVRAAANRLPAQNPIEDFVHHNTLHAYEDLPFFAAVERAWEELGVEGTLSLDELRRLHESGRIRRRDLLAAIEEAGLPRRTMDLLLGGDLPRSAERIATRVPTLRDAHLFATGENLEARVRPPLVRFLSGYLDQGVAQWSLPTKDLPLAEAWLASQRAGLERLALPARDAVERLRRVGARAFVIEVADDLGIAEEDVGHFVRGELFVMPGWAGMVRMLPHPRATSLDQLTDYLAVRLAKEVGALRERHGATLRHVWSRAARARLGDASRAGDGLLDELTARALFQAAYEGSYRSMLISALAQARADAPRESEERPCFALVTCFDDREESLRRHVEEREPRAVTFGAAGFFGLPIVHRPLGAPGAEARCPVGVEGVFASEEAPLSPDDAERWLHRRGALAKLRRWEHASARTLLGSTVLAALRGAVDALAFGATLVSPEGPRTLARTLVGGLAPPPRAQPVVRDLDVAAAAEALGVMLRTAGLRAERMPRLVVVLGHGASSVNNPHAAAYACGACRGRDGAANARLFAWLANHDEVRRRLRETGFALPDDTVFVGGLHDTTTDQLWLDDRAHVPASHAADVEHFERVLADALGENARERCRRLVSAPRAPSAASALRHVRARSLDPSEVRPELGHATVAAAIVGRRARTRGLFLDRRVFLVSYDPTLDVDGALLDRLLGAALPVGAGIALEYYWSRVDPEHLGAGTKLPHNPVGQIGVMEGSHGDLRTGLPTQMVEIHEPMRLQVFVEAAVDVLRSIVERRPEVRRLVENEWVTLVALDPVDGTARRLRGGELVVEGASAPIGRVASSADWTRGHDGPLPPVRVGEGGGP